MICFSIWFAICHFRNSINLSCKFFKFASRSILYVDERCFSHNSPNDSKNWPSIKETNKAENFDRHWRRRLRFWKPVFASNAAATNFHCNRIASLHFSRLSREAGLSSGADISLRSDKWDGRSRSIERVRGPITSISFSKEGGRGTLTESDSYVHLTNSRKAEFMVRPTTGGSSPGQNAMAGKFTTLSSGEMDFLPFFA